MVKTLKIVVFYSLLAFFSNAANAANGNIGQAVKEAFSHIFSNPVLARHKLDSLSKHIASASDSVKAKLYNSYGIYYAVTGKNDSALFCFDKVLVLFKNYPSEIAGTLVNKSIIYKTTKNYVTALSLLNEALELYEKLDDNNGIAYVYSEKSSNYNQLTKYDLAVQYSLKSIESYEKNKIQNAENVAVGKQKLGNLYSMLKDYEFAIKLFSEALIHFKNKNDYYKYGITLINNADANYHLNKFVLAKENVTLAIQLLLPFNNFDILSLAYKHQANIYAKLNRSDLANIGFDSALYYSQKGNSTYYKYIYVDKITFFVEQKNYAKANALIANVDDKSFTNDFDLLNKISFTELKVNVFTKLNMANKCLVAYEELSNLKDSLFEFSKNEDALKLQAKYKASILQKEVEIANYNNKLLVQETEISKRSLIIVIVVFLLVLIFSIYRIQVHKLHRNLKEVELERLEQEREFLVSEKSILDENIKLKEDIILQQKSELFGMLQQEAGWIEKVNTLVEKLTIAEQVPFKNRFQELIANDKSWDIFINKFQHINPTFIQHLSIKFPELSKGDLEFCALVKMSISYKEIANLLGISHKSVIIKKYRLVKKINLNSDEDFFNLILSID